VPPAKNVIQVKGLRKSYGSLTAVDSLDLTIEEGEIFALLGPNGAGKTTTVEILEGYRSRDCGEVSVLGFDPATRGDVANAWRDRIGIVLQDSADGADLTVEESISHFSKYYSRRRDLDQLIEAVGLDEKRKYRVHTLSGGQRRRLDVALGLVGTPELLFLDEPTTGFDPQARRAFWDLIKTLKEDGTTILLTTHYLDEAEALADRVGVITEGKLIEVATPATLGGREQALAMVSWRDKSGVLREESAVDPTSILRRLLNEFDGEIPALSVKRPTLEEIYLRMIGQSR
jgi:ABC-2 type transport system ATP-binding protein